VLREPIALGAVPLIMAVAVPITISMPVVTA